MALSRSKIRARAQAKKKMEQVLTKVLQGAEAPGFPQLTLKILQKVRDPGCETDELADCLQWDPALVIRVLKTVNTAAYGPANPIQNVHHAVSYMGRSQLEQIVLALAVSDALPAGPTHGFDGARFWKAASKRAALSRLIADKLHPQTNAEAFTGGLLQDMAIPVLAHNRTEEYGPILEHWHSERGASLEDLERQVLGWTHADVGGLLGKLWQLPAGLSKQIFHHHRTDLTDSDLLPALRLVAVLRETEEEYGFEALMEVAGSDYGLGHDWTSAALESADRQAQELAQLML